MISIVWTLIFSTLSGSLLRYLKKMKEKWRRISCRVEKEEKKFRSLLVEKEEADSLSRGIKFPSVGIKKSDIKLQYVIQAKVNLLRPRDRISLGISLFFIFSSSVFFSPFEWQIWLFFRNDWKVKGAQINVTSVTTPFFCWVVPQERSSKTQN